MVKLMGPVLLVALGPAAAFAQQAQTTVDAASASTTLEEITVTAEKVEENLQKVAISMSAISGSMLNERGQVSVNEALKDVPGVVVQGAARGYVIAIRGLGSDLPPGVGESSVSTNFDGVYNFRAESGVLGYYDLARVEVLRGPQGTLYGRNATGGVVNVISNDPTDEFGGRATLEVGNYSLLRAEGALNVPLNEDWAARIAAVSIDRDGFHSNGGSDAVGRAARAKLAFEPNDDVSVIFASEYTKLGGKGPIFTAVSDFDAGRPFVTGDPEEVSQDYEAYKLSAQASLAAGPGVITFVPAYQHAQGVVFGASPPGSLTAVSKSLDPKDARQFSAELRYASASDAEVQWVTGLYYYDLRSTVSAVGGNTGFATDWTKSYAAFGQVTYPLSDAFRIVGGVRGASDTKEYDSPAITPASDEESWNAFDYKLGGELDFSDSSLGYVTLASGHRPGGFNTFFGGGADRTFEPEELLSLEIGVKNRFADDRLQLNGNIYYYDYEDFQVADFFLPPGEPTPLLVISNVGAVKNYGAELEGQALVGERTLVALSATYLHSRYDADFVLHGGPLDPPPPNDAVNMNGKSLPHAPEWAVKGALEHTMVLGSFGTLTPSVSLRWVDDQFVAPYPGTVQRQEAYTQWDASARYEAPSRQWSVNLYVRNAGDEIIKTAFFATQYIVGNPRQWGAVFNVQF